jgi:hypothetical protein
MTRRLAAAVALALMALAGPLAAQTVAPQPSAATVEHPDIKNARQALQGVLADRRFERARRTSWQTMLMQRIREALADLFGRLPGRKVAGFSLGELLAWTASIAALAVLGVWLLRLTLRARADRPVGVGSVGQVQPPGHELGLQALELIRAGRIREGARAAYRATLRRLEEEGALRADPANTPRENLRLLAPSHRRAAPLRSMTSTFERIWYGARPAGADEGSRLLGLLREMECLPSERPN